MLVIDLNGFYLLGKYTGTNIYGELIDINDLGNNYVKITNGGILSYGDTTFNSPNENPLVGISCYGDPEAEKVGGLIIDNVDIVMGTQIKGSQAANIQQTAVIASNSNLTMQGDANDGVDGDNDTTINHITVNLSDGSYSGNMAAGGVAFFNSNPNIKPTCNITDTTMLNVNRGLGTNGSEDQQAMEITLGSNAFIKTVMAILVKGAVVHFICLIKMLQQ